NETTTTLIGNAVLELLAHPPALAALRARPELLPDAVEEVLRFSSPIQMDPRRAARATEIRGHHIETGQIVLSWLGSANRDETVFERPDEFDIARRDNRHLGFGFGPHYCLGASLATLEAQVAPRVLRARTRILRRFHGDTKLRLTTQPSQRRGGLLLQNTSPQQFQTELNLGDVHRREIYRFLPGDGVNVRRSELSALDRDPDAGVNQPAHGFLS